MKSLTIPLTNSSIQSPKHATSWCKLQSLQLPNKQKGKTAAVCVVIVLLALLGSFAYQGTSCEVVSREQLTMPWVEFD